ncbi:molybdopterin cofactor-binding domain-containing protein [Nocardiopsis alborubida]|uniref:Molybdopterin-dependent oxidoreductase n=1 Tax=Nocardiopsis alborubida TaxID=146802 RepID=A0A7X6MI48_9ACTN|nr:molybdopterin cofactor-binding domain-containing protein [Nocardiopsis alborubida]NKZ02019.1 molybdopterin-dependent oxidoreductase [Nocardiopsis alborubida]
MTNRVTFHLNGTRVELVDPSPHLLLVDYLRSDPVGLTGTKKSCGQGGCGACTVVLSHWDSAQNTAHHRAANSCLRPVCSLDGMAVTTIEGTGSAQRPAPAHLSHGTLYSFAAAPSGFVPSTETEAVQTLRQAQESTPAPAGPATSTAQDGPQPEPTPCRGMNPVAYRLAANNGTQCGFCTPGFVMNMTGFLVNHPRATKADIEGALDGNLCRCTGYRPILTGMKTFASDWTPQDEEKRMHCVPEPVCCPPAPEARPALPYPEDAKTAPGDITVKAPHTTWLTAHTLEQLRTLLTQTTPGTTRLVCANTSYGVYPQEIHDAARLIDIRHIPQLHQHDLTDTRLRVGAATTYTDLITHLDRALTAHPGAASLQALRLMARRTAGTLVRNTATLGGNTMLVLHHLTQGEPFPSDLFTTMVATDTALTYWRASTNTTHTDTAQGLLDHVSADPTLLQDLLLLSYDLPLTGRHEHVTAYKTALREVNAHTLVNAATRLSTRASTGDGVPVDGARLVFAGIAAAPWRARRTEQELARAPLTHARIPALLATLRQETAEALAATAPARAHHPDEGVTDAYRTDLVCAFARKSLLSLLLSRSPDLVPATEHSGATAPWGTQPWGAWPVSGGQQTYTPDHDREPVSEPHVKHLSMYQASGQVRYTQDVAVPETTAHAALVTSRRALARFAFTVPGTRDSGHQALRRHLAEHHPAFLGLVTCADVPPAGSNRSGMAADQPLFADQRVMYAGQTLALVAATDDEQAQRIAAYVTDHCVTYTPVDWPAPWDTPVLSLKDALARGSVFPDCPKDASFVSHIWKVTRPGSDLSWTRPSTPYTTTEPTTRTTSIDNNTCTVVDSPQTTGGQAHFYMETQACLVEPADGDRWSIRVSTQSPMEMHQTAAHALGVEHHRVEVRVDEVGGGYGGKTEPTRFVTGPAVIAAHTLNRPVRLVVPRDQDTALIGKRHPYHGQAQIAVDTGAATPAAKGLIRGMSTLMWGDGGAYYDCSFIVSNCIQLRADNAYRVPHFENTIDVCRTNTAPNTAFRGFGDLQSKIITENAIDDAAFTLGMSPEQVRERNLYRRGDVTPFGQALSYCYIRQVWDYLKETAGYEAKAADVARYNRDNTWRKRGLAMIPVKYGSGYNAVMLEQAAAHAAVHTADGSVVIHQGGVEMGQGLITKIEQIAAHVLNIPMSLLRVEGPRTSVIPNPTSTGASTGTSYNGEAVKQVCEQLRRRLADFGTRMLREHGDAWCAGKGIDYWNHGAQGWAAQTEVGGRRKLVWQNLVDLAFNHRVSLVASLNAPITGGETPVPALTYKKPGQTPPPGIEVDPTAVPGGGVTSFTGFTYSAACSVVETDILTGEVKILSSDLVYDMGRSINPALDVGQIEGAFVQGVGYLLTEHLAYQGTGAERGRLNSTNTWRYKPPAASTIPLTMNTRLFPRDLAGDVPDNPNDLLSAKEVGEPPLILAATVFFAVKAAVRASRLERGLSGLFRMDAPATVQEVRRACALT